MCSLSGYFVTNRKLYKKNLETVRTMMTNLAIQSMVRGWQGTGFMSYDTTFHYAKTEKTPSYFVKYSNAYKACINENTKVFAFHTRWPSTGKVCKKNSHPFVGSRYAIEHNGIIPEFPTLSDNKLGLLKNYFSVDSRVIVYFLEKYNGNSSFLIDKLPQSDYALAVMRIKDGKIWFTRRVRPLVFCSMRTRFGVVFWASTGAIMEEAFFDTFKKKLVWNDKMPPENKILNWNYKKGIFEVHNTHTILR